jgi:hypothetical protein
VIASVLAVASVTLVGGEPTSAAFRDINVEFTNRSDSELTLVSAELGGGCWVAQAPARVLLGQTVDIISESCGVLTGTEFRVIYRLDRTGQTLVLHYNNPAVGSDDFIELAPVGYRFESFGVIEDRTTRFFCDSLTCDGIPDDWKRNGVTIDPGGGRPPQFVDLPRMGVTLDRPNVLVHLDWMADDTNDQRLRQAAIDTVIRAFDQQPTVHLGATRPGITLIVDAGPDSTITPGGATWGSLSRAVEVDWSAGLLMTDTDGNYQNANLYSLIQSNFVPTGRLPIFHYAIAAAGLASEDCTSGMATGDRLGFIVSLGGTQSGNACWAGRIGSQDQQAGTFMHELGHVLGLDHSGGEGNDTNFKPNHPSVMNYAYQTRGVFRGGTQVFDFSRDDMPAVDETTLTEAGGVDLGTNSSGYGTTNSCEVTDAAGDTSIVTFIQAALSPVDWNCDGSATTGGTGFDGNGDGAQTTLAANRSDWRRLELKTGGVGAGANAKDVVTIPSSGTSPGGMELTAEQDRLIRTLPLPTNLTYTGSTSGDYHDLASMSATLEDPGDGDSGIAGKTILFRIGPGSADTCSATTSPSGVASCTIDVSQAPAGYTVSASFAGDPVYRPASDSASFDVTREESTATFTGPTVILAGSGTATLTAELVEDGANDDDGDGGSAAPVPWGQTITFSLAGRTCSGVTDAAGVASCSIADVPAESLGETTVTTTFSGDRYYRPATDTDEVIVFAFPERGAFVLGDDTVSTTETGGTVTWWHDAWYARNSVSGGVAPSSFKGFAAHVTSLPTTTPADSCGVDFHTRPGSSPPPPAEVPSYMGVIVADDVDKSGNSVMGTWGRIVVVDTDAGYRPVAGHPGTGTIVATFCP